MKRIEGERTISAKAEFAACIGTVVIFATALVVILIGFWRGWW